MLVYKMIFRLDFRRQNFDILDSPGKVMKIMHELGEKFWSEFQDTPQSRVLSAVFRDNERCSRFRQLTVDPSMMNFTLQDAKGIELAGLASNDSYITLFKGIQELCDTFKINELRRAGLRFLCLGSIGDNNTDLRPVFETFLDGDVLKIIQTSIGDQEDYGIHLDGFDKDKIKYHLRFGPYRKEEAGRYFEQVHEQITEGTSANFICDLDLYEENFALKYQQRSIAWTKPLVIKVQKLTDSIAELISTRL